MFLAFDTGALHILRLFQTGRFLLRHHAIGFGPALHFFHVALTVHHPVRFRCGQLTSSHALGNTGTLVLLALVNAVFRSNSKRTTGDHQCGQ